MNETTTTDTPENARDAIMEAYHKRHYSELRAVVRKFWNRYYHAPYNESTLLALVAVQRSANTWGTTEALELCRAADLMLSAIVYGQKERRVVAEKEMDEVYKRILALPYDE